MSAFKKWWKVFTPLEGCPEKEYKHAYRAALERVLVECRHYQSQDVVDFILKELEEL